MGHSIIEPSGSLVSENTKLNDTINNKKLIDFLIMFYKRLLDFFKINAVFQIAKGKQRGG